MKKHLTKIRVRYAETDQMGVVHHGNYAQYFEMARIQWLDSFGISYKELEKRGVMLPVYQMKTKFLKPAFFDDELEIETSLRGKPTVRIVFDYKIRNKNGELLTEGETMLIFTDTDKQKPIRCPQDLLDTLGF